MSDKPQTTEGERRVHELKLVPPYFGAVFHGEKTAELRRHDRDFRVGDELLLREYLPTSMTYSASRIRAEVTHIVTDAEGPWLAEGHCMLSFKVLEVIP